MTTVLVVDDEKDICDLIKMTLSPAEMMVLCATDLKSAKQCLAKKNINLCLTDMRLPDGDGLELIEHIQENFPHIPVAMITAYGNTSLAVTALKAGAFDFISKPIDVENLRALVSQALQIHVHTADKATTLQRSLLGESKVMQQLQEHILKLSCSQAPVFIHGASGVGKELVARLIHATSARSDKPFIAVNCGAIPMALMESEFFGHVKGSFTGAHQNSNGLFQAADRGTLFLDEIGELPFSMQVKLLRAIQEKAIRRVGDGQEQTVDVRVLSATHHNLQDLVQAGTFREDLYYRINVITLQVPSLAERKDDLPLLIEHILKKIAAEYKCQSIHLSDEAKNNLLQYHFPGNVRELENILERAFTLSDNQKIEAKHLLFSTISNRDKTPVADDATVSNETSFDEAEQVQPFFQAKQKDPDLDLNQYLESVEAALIKAALKQCQWNRSNAAQLLGISVRTLRYRLKKLEHLMT